MINDVSAAFDIWLEPINISRENPGLYLNGKWQIGGPAGKFGFDPDPTAEGFGTTSDSTIGGNFWDGSTDPEVIPINAVVQNAVPDDLIVLQEGQRSSESVKLHTTTDLVAVSEADRIVGDKFTYEDKLWQVMNVARRFIGNYHKAIAVRIPS